MAAFGCDQGDPDLDPGRGPPLHVVATHPAAGAGLECPTGGDPNCGVPRNTNIELRLDRYILPKTAIRQSLALYTGSPDNSVFLQPEYDVVERVLLFRLGPGAKLEPATTYTVEILIPSDDSDGLRAFDGAPLGQGPVPLEFDFRTQGITPADPPAPPVAPSCQDMLDAFDKGTGGCRTCHAVTVDENDQARPPRMGLSLDSEVEILETAINRVAHQTDTGAKVGVPLDNPLRFGTQMPIIDPGRPENSYLLYKILRNERNYDLTPLGCTSVHQVALADECPKPSSAESVRLQEWFVRGQPMPLPAPAQLPLERKIDPRDVQSWIRAGAHCP